MWVNWVIIGSGNGLSPAVHQKPSTKSMLTLCHDNLQGNMNQKWKMFLFRKLCYALCWTLLIYADWATSSQWLQMFWHQISARPSATTMLNWLWLYCLTSHVVWHRYHSTAIKSHWERVGGWQVISRFVLSQQRHAVCCLQYVSHFTMVVTLFRLECANSVMSSIRPVQQIPQCTSPMSHNAPFCNRNVHVCTFLLQNGALWDIYLMHCGICETGLLADIGSSLFHNG